MITILVVAALAAAVKRYRRRARQNTANILAQLRTHRRAAAVANPASLAYDQSRFIKTTDRAQQRTAFANETYHRNEEEGVYQDGDEPVYMDAGSLEGRASGVGGSMLDVQPYDTVESPQLYSDPSEDGAAAIYAEATQVCSASDGANYMEITGDDGTSEQFTHLTATDSPALVQTAVYSLAADWRELELANPTYHFCDGSAEADAVYQDGDAPVYTDAVTLKGGVGDANVVHATVSDATGPSAYAHLTAEYSTHRAGSTEAYDCAGPSEAGSADATAAKLFPAGANPRKPHAYVNDVIAVDGVVPGQPNDNVACNTLYGEVSDGNGAEPVSVYFDVKPDEDLYVKPDEELYGGNETYGNMADGEHVLSGAIWQDAGCLSVQGQAMIVRNELGSGDVAQASSQATA